MIDEVIVGVCIEREKWYNWYEDDYLWYLQFGKWAPVIVE